jgi:hypothetical protein
LTPTGVTSTQIIVSVPASDLAKEENILVSVVNPANSTTGASFTISDPSVTAVNGSGFTATAGADSSLQTVATFTDPAGAEPNTSDPTGVHYTASIDWGDGTLSPDVTTGTVGGPFDNGLFTVSGSHTFANAGRYTITTTIHHETAADQTASDVATVNPAGAQGPLLLTLPVGDALQVQQAPDGVVGDIVYAITGSDGTMVGQPVSLKGVTSLTINGGGVNTLTIQFPKLGVSLLTGNIHFVGGGTTNKLTLLAPHLNVKVDQGVFTVGDPQIVTYSNVSTIQIDGAAAVNSFAGPDTADRATAFVGLTAQERFVQALYLDELGRAGTVAELDGWVAVLNGPGGSPANVASDIANSLEAQDHLVKSWYLSYLGRAASNGEELGWVNMLQQGQSGEQVLSDILGGPEFFNRAQTLFSTGTPQQNYVQALYQLLLGRTGGSDEVAGWVNQLNAQTLTPQGVALAFQQAPEFRTDLTEAYYNALLHRPDDPMGLNGWVFSNLDAASIRLGFEASPEFYTNG